MVMITQVTYAHDLVQAINLYASRNGGRCPAKIEDLSPYFPDKGAAGNGPAPDRFEIVYQGSLTELTNRDSVIVVRQKQGWQAADGNWRKAYGFADGHSEIHMEPDGNFGPYEAQHISINESH